MEKIHLPVDGFYLSTGRWIYPSTSRLISSIYQQERKRVEPLRNHYSNLMLSAIFEPKRYPSSWNLRSVDNRRFECSGKHVSPDRKVLGSKTGRYFMKNYFPNTLTKLLRLTFDNLNDNSKLTPTPCDIPKSQQL